MKKILLLISVSLLLLTGCSDGIPEKISDKAASTTKLTQVKPSYVVELIESKASFIFYFGNSWCTACQFMKDVNNEVVVKGNLPIYYIEMDKTSTKQLNMIFKYVIRPQVTPTYIIVKNGIVMESFTPEVIVGDDLDLNPDHIQQYATTFIALLKTKGLIAQ